MIAAMSAMASLAVNAEEPAVTIDQIKLGEDYTDISADLKFLTHKTDIVDTTFKTYVEEFQKLYPNVNIEYVELIVNNPAAAGEENLWNDINNDSELGINASGAVPTQIVEAAVTGSETMEELVDEWNEKWTDAQEDNGITH